MSLPSHHLDDEAILRPRPRMLLLVPVLVILLAEAGFQVLSALVNLRELGIHTRAPAVAVSHRGRARSSRLSRSSESRAAADSGWYSSVPMRL